MHSNVGLWIEAGMYLFAFFIIIPLIAGVIGLAAWRGKPKNFSRELYWTAFASAVVSSAFVFSYAIKMHADVRTWQYLLQLSCFGLGVLLIGIASGCAVGIFAYRRGLSPESPPQQ
jgi:uncharacterized membrane protein